MLLPSLPLVRHCKQVAVVLLEVGLEFLLLPFRDRYNGVLHEALLVPKVEVLHVELGIFRFQEVTDL